MRKFLISAAVAASTIAIASPAAAQYYPQPQGYAYGYNNNYGQARSLVARLDQIRNRIERLDARNRITEREADRLRYEARIVRNQVRQAAFNGLSFRERQALEYRIARLEQRVRHEVNDGNRWGQNDRRWDNDGRRWDAEHNRWHNNHDDDRDGRDDRYEDDRGRDHDD